MNLVTLLVAECVVLADPLVPTSIKNDVSVPVGPDGGAHRHRIEPLGGVTDEIVDDRAKRVPEKGDDALALLLFPAHDRDYLDSRPGVCVEDFARRQIAEVNAGGHRRVEVYRAVDLFYRVAAGSEIWSETA